MFLYRLSSDQKFAFLKLARDVVLADKKIDDGERAIIGQLCHEMGISHVNMTRTQDVNDLTSIFDTRPIRVLVMVELLQVATADGAMCVVEHDVVNTVRKQFGFTNEEFRTHARIAESYNLLLKDLNAAMGG